jgi:hypothetical protein
MNRHFTLKKIIEPGGKLVQHGWDTMPMDRLCVLSMQVDLHFHAIYL